ncbi:xanthine dehydrogenase small subunit [Roseateles asaccharophilus]|uniref:Xanthine dehydrogenase small subunit n=1 Tax=Roseateles asaccharophilus TaxID=582607 RepID=A0ABU2AC96_9BURK|nr:xanthine dehydrogenase small subunit [Roseateles asaccharophilus]MDR7334811.1 xanthine dehydrogenase small subunit [Roseateles asaccharophilus]
MDTQTRPIRFYHHDRGEIVNITDMAPTRSVLNWLREDARCTGTKEGCNEGDCGACTVIVAELADQARQVGTPSAEATIVGELSLRTVNACIQFLPTLDGKALLTVEDLQQIGGGALHPAQQALVECHGSQCGFCTPGFAMSLTACYERHCEAGTRPTRQQLADELSGNLCRCTGYRPILDAGERMFDLPAARLNTQPIVKALRELQLAGGLAYEAPNPAMPTDAGPRQDRYWAPRSVDEFATLRMQHPQARLLAGSTDIGLWVNKQFRDVGDLLYINDVAELKRITRDDGLLRIGAAAPLEDAWSALATEWPVLQDMWLRFASLPVRNAGTMGGSIANGSPIGDSAPVLMALGTQAVLRRGATQRRLLLEDFYLDYMKNALRAGEFIEALEVPLPAPATTVRAYKLSKRFDCDISAVAVGLTITRDGDTVTAARFAFGGMAATVKRAAHAEAAVVGQPWNDATTRAAMTALALDFKPLTDMRASAGYRLRASANLLRRFWLETRRDAPLAIGQTSVWSVMPHLTVTA